MLIGELLRVAWKAITAHKLRSFLTLLGVIIGVMTVIAVVAVISGLNNYVATKIFTLSPDVYAVTRWGIITSREEFLEALKRKPSRSPTSSRSSRLARLADKVGAAVGNVQLVKYGEPPALGRPDQGHDGEHERDPEPRHRVRALLHGDRERAPRLRRRDRIGRPGRALSRASTRSAARSRSAASRSRSSGSSPSRARSSGRARTRSSTFPRETLVQGLGGEPEHLGIYVQAKGGVPGVPASMDEIRTIFRAIRHTDPKAPDPVVFVNADAIQVVWKSISAAAFALLVFISGISLVVGRDRDREHHARLRDRADEGDRPAARGRRPQSGTSAGSSSSRRASSPSAAARSASSSAGSSRSAWTRSRRSRRS